jgi:hypothetical protein
MNSFAAELKTDRPAALVGWRWCLSLGGSCCRYLRLKAEQPAAYLVRPRLVEAADALTDEEEATGHSYSRDELSASRSSSSSAISSSPHVGFEVNHSAFARLIELVLERRPQRSQGGGDNRENRRESSRGGTSSVGEVRDDADMIISTMGAEDYLSALIWTLELTGNAATR